MKLVAACELVAIGILLYLYLDTRNDLKHEKSLNNTLLREGPNVAVCKTCGVPMASFAELPEQPPFLKLGVPFYRKCLECSRPTLLVGGSLVVGVDWGCDPAKIVQEKDEPKR